MFRGRLRKELHPSVVKHITKPYLEAARRDLPHHIYIHKAHVIMLKERGILTAAEAQLILKGLFQLESVDIYALDLDVGTDLYMNLENQLIKTVGEVGGKVHIGRSRNDIYATSLRMEFRNQILATLKILQQFIETILELAQVHSQTLMPGYTHWQHAQPVTLGHYLTGITQAVGRDVKRLMGTYERVNLCPLGAAALATTGFPIDRERTAALLGFDGVVENSYDAVASRDFVPEAASDLAILMTTLSRFSEDLVIWNTLEFSTVDVPEEFSITSSIMPQKKNPFVLEHIKGRTGHVIAAVTSALTVLKGTSFAHNREVGGETASLVHKAFELTQGCLEMFIPLIPRLSFNEPLLKERTYKGFSTVTELADLLVYERDVPFRQAHMIIGQVVNQLLDNHLGMERLSSEMIDHASKEILGRDLLLPEERVRKALDPNENVVSRKVLGGPGPASMKAIIDHQMEQIKETENWLSCRKGDLEKAKEACKRAQAEFISGSV